MVYDGCTRCLLQPGRLQGLGTPGGAPWVCLVPTRPQPGSERGSHSPAASADVSGKLRIWDTTQKEHLLKYEYQPFAGKIKDIAWTEDSKRIAVVGEGR